METFWWVDNRMTSDGGEQGVSCFYWFSFEVPGNNYLKVTTKAIKMEVGRRGHQNPHVCCKRFITRSAASGTAISKINRKGSILSRRNLFGYSCLAGPHPPKRPRFPWNLDLWLTGKYWGSRTRVICNKTLAWVRRWFLELRRPWCDTCEGDSNLAQEFHGAVSMSMWRALRLYYDMLIIC